MAKLCYNWSAFENFTIVDWIHGLVLVYVRDVYGEEGSK